ncbi:right-handed parallel beta-helix repeat-containing protein [Actinomycetes bacterium KLBMP 9759]
MQGEGAGGLVARIGLAVVTFVAAVAGVVVATEGVRFPVVEAPSVAFTPAAVRACSTTGAYVPPEPGSVGVPVGTQLCPSGTMVVSQAGAVLDGWDVRGGVIVDAADVVVRRSRITGDGSTPYGIYTTPAGSVRIEDSTLTGDFAEAAVGDDRWSGTRLEISGVTRDGVRLGEGARLTNSVIHNFAPAPGTLRDGILIEGPGALVEDNRVEIGAGRGSAVRLTGTSGRVDAQHVIRGNTLGGGGYTLYQDQTGGGRTDVRITGNVFHRDAEQGPLRVAPQTVVTDNRFADGGPLPGR